MKKPPCITQRSCLSSWLQKINWTCESTPLGWEWVTKANNICDQWVNGDSHYCCLPNVPTFSPWHLVWWYFSMTMNAIIWHSLARELWAPEVWVTWGAVSNLSLLFSPLSHHAPSSGYSLSVSPGERMMWKFPANSEEHRVWARNKSCGFTPLRCWHHLACCDWYNHNSIFSGIADPQVDEAALHLVTETHAKGFPVTPSNVTDDIRVAKLHKVV